MTGSTRWTGLDGLRALAVVAVVAFHFAPDTLPGGFLGVDLFFVLSGYLITRMLATEYLRDGRIDFPRFYRRRARRLLPALGLLLVAGLAVSVFWRDQLATIRAAAAAAAAYVSNWWLAFAHQSYFVSAGRPSMLQHLWSLAVEEQFYLLWPVVALLVLRRSGGARVPARSTRRLALVAVALALLSTGLMSLLAVLERVPYGSDGSRLYYGTDTHSMGLLLGAAAGALAADRLRPRPHRWKLLWVSDAAAVLAIAGLVLLFLRAGQYDGWLYRGGFLGVAAVGCVAVAAVTRKGSRVGRVLEVPPLRWLAARSYAIYLWHWPVAVFTRPGVDLSWPAPAVLVLRVAVTVVLGDLTYRLVERPIRRLGFRDAIRHGRLRAARIALGRAPVGARLAGVAALGTVVLAGAVLVAAPKPPQNAAQQAAGAGGRTMVLAPPTTPAASTPAASTPVPSAAPTSPAVTAASTAPTAPTATPTTHPPAHAGPTPVSAFGDSVMLGARDMLTQHFPGATLDAVEGRQPDPILADVLSDKQHRTLRAVVIIGVGDNGLIDPDSLHRTLSALGAHRVIVINNRVDRPWESPNNRTIATVTKRFHYVRMLDWHARSAGHPSWFYSDGIHLTPAGAAAYSSMLAALAR